MIFTSAIVCVFMLLSWLVLFAIRTLRIKRKRGELTKNHFAETLVQTFGISTLLGGILTNFNYFVAMLCSEPLVASESLVYSSFAFGIMDMLLVFYFFYYPLPE